MAKKLWVKRSTKVVFMVGNKKAGSLTLREWGPNSKKISRQIYRKEEFELLCPSQKTALIEYDRYFGSKPNLIV